MKPKACLEDVEKLVQEILHGQAKKVRDSAMGTAEQELSAHDEFRRKMAPEDVYWYYLSVVLHDSRPGENLLTRIHLNPWKHSDERVRKVWGALTDPRNTALLKKRFDRRLAMNHEARRLVEEAWRQLQERPKQEA